MFSFSRTALIRRCLLTAVAALVLGPLLVWSSLRCVETMFNTPHLWVAADHPQRREFDWFVEHFESPALVVISWPGCTVDDLRLEAFETELLDPAETDRSNRGALFERVVTGQSVLGELRGEPLDFSRQEALARLRGVLVGADGSSSCALVIFSERGGYDREEAIRQILDTAHRVCGLDRSEFRIAGPPVDGVAIDKAGVETMVHFALPSALASLCFCWWCLRAWRYALAILAVAGFGEGVCLTLVFYSRIPMNAILILMPPLVFVLTIAAGVHLVNYYLDEVRLRDVEGATQRAIRAGWFPSVLATATTAIGLGSLLVSRVEPIRMFGGFATIGVLVTLLLLFLVLPGAMELWPQSRPTERPRQWRLAHFWTLLAEFVIGRASIICVVALLLMAALGWGLRHIETSVKLRDLFSPRDRILADYAWLEKQIGPMVPVEVIVHVRHDSRMTFARRLQLVEAVAAKVGELEEVGGVMSAVTFALPDRGGSGMRQVVTRSVSRLRFRQARYLYEDAAGQSWRISARVPALGDLEYGQFLEHLKSHVTPVTDAFSKAAGEPIETTVTGAIPLIYQTQRILLSDLIRSFVAAFAIVGVMMMIVLRSVRAGLLVMIPNVFPTALVFGLMGWLQYPIDIGSVMTASIALGISVVDTVHFLTWFRREVSAGHGPPDAVRRAYAHCATAMLQTSVICGVGMLVFVFTTFVPASRFAWMVFVLLMAALAGDLVLLPAILAGPLGRQFLRHLEAKGGKPQ